MLFRLALVFTMFAPAVLAQDTPRFDSAPVLACLAQGKEGACIGVATEACTASTPGGDSTVGYSFCAQGELQFWDAELNRLYRQRMAIARSLDAEPQIPDWTPRPSDVEALRAMQRAWIAFRDATCHFEEIQWWGGTGMGGAGIACRMRLTAQQALYLRSLGEG